MSLRTDKKDELTEYLRQMLGRNIVQVYETSRAETSLCTLSFQSTTHPERQVWIDTDLKGIGIDLEDWNRESEWDNAVARIKVESLEEAVEIIQVWLSGKNLDNYYSNINKKYEKVFKK